MSDRKYRLRNTIRTPFGTWEAGELRTEDEWRAIAPNGSQLVELDALSNDFEWVSDDVADARVINGELKLMVNKSIWNDYGFFNEGQGMESLGIRPECVKDLRDACNKYLEMMKDKPCK